MAILHEIHDAISQSLVDSELRHAVLEATFFKLEIPPIVERVALGLVNFCLCVEQRVNKTEKTFSPTLPEKTVRKLRLTMQSNTKQC